MKSVKSKLITGICFAFPLLAFGAGEGVSMVTGDGTDYRDLMLRAMDAKDGKAVSDVTGRTAEMIRQQINRPNARVVAEVTTVEQLKQEGCKRFNIRFTTPGTLLPMTDGSSRNLDMSMRLNMCRNGFPPGSDNEVDLNEKIFRANEEARSQTRQSTTPPNPQKSDTSKVR